MRKLKSKSNLTLNYDSERHSKSHDDSSSNSNSVISDQKVHNPKQAQESWLDESNNGIVIRLKIQAQASKTEIAGFYGGDQLRLKIRVAAKPIDQAANEELLKFLRRILKVSSSQLHLIRGHLSPFKDVLCQGLNLEFVRGALARGQKKS